MLARRRYGASVPLLGILFFLVVIAALIIATYRLSRRYSVGRDRRVEEVARESEPRDGGSGNWTYFGNRDPSPRDRLRSPETEERD